MLDIALVLLTVFDPVSRKVFTLLSILAFFPIDLGVQLINLPLRTLQHVQTVEITVSLTLALVLGLFSVPRVLLHSSSISIKRNKLEPTARG